MCSLFAENPTVIFIKLTQLILYGIRNVHDAALTLLWTVKIALDTWKCVWRLKLPQMLKSGFNSCRQLVKLLENSVNVILNKIWNE